MNINDETWKDIPGFEGLYQASTFGRIKRLRSFVERCTPNYKNHALLINGIIRKLTNHSSGYLRASLTIRGKVTHYYVHNLIAITFIGFKEEGYDVDHINKNRKDNRLANLRYLTTKENRGHKGNKYAKKYKL